MLWLVEQGTVPQMVRHGMLHNSRGILCCIVTPDETGNVSCGVASTRVRVLLSHGGWGGALANPSTQNFGKPKTHGCPTPTGGGGET